jgi:hypothetical protein
MIELHLPAVHLADPSNTQTSVQAEPHEVLHERCHVLKELFLFLSAQYPGVNGELAKELHLTHGIEIQEELPVDR